MNNHCIRSIIGKTFWLLGTRPTSLLLLGEGSYMDEDLELLKVAAGLETVQLGSIGVYHYRLSDSARNVSTCSIISKPGPRVRVDFVNVVCT